jgi:hypothetical protein
MWLFGRIPKLIRALDSLAIYNDKGISWAKHSVDQVSMERSSRLAKVHSLVEAIGPAKLPAEFLSALNSGLVATDGTGRYRDLVKERCRGPAAV